MDITRRCDYACRMLRAAYINGERRVSVADLAESEGIPYAFARSIQHDLAKCGFVSTTRGSHGGLRLGCDPNVVTLRDVVEAVQGPLSVSECDASSSPCGNCNTCVYNKVWRGADRILGEYLGSITLRDLFELGGEHPVVKEAIGDSDEGCSACNGRMNMALSEAVRG